MNNLQSLNLLIEQTMEEVDVEIVEINTLAQLYELSGMSVGGGDVRNELSTASDLNETSLEQSLIDIAAFIDERGSIQPLLDIDMKSSVLITSNLN